MADQEPQIVQNSEYVAQAVLIGLREAGLLKDALVTYDPKSHLTAVQQLSNTSKPIISQDLEGKLAFANPAALDFFGYKLEEFLGMPSLDLIHNDAFALQRRDESIRRILTTGNPEFFENTPRLRKGRIMIMFQNG